MATCRFNNALRHTDDYQTIFTSDFFPYLDLY